MLERRPSATSPGFAVTCRGSVAALISRLLRGHWDAFNDCFDDPPLPPRSALLWRGAQRLATNDLEGVRRGDAVLRTGIDAVERRRAATRAFLLQDPESQTPDASG